MGKHTRPSAPLTTAPGGGVRARPLPVRSTVRLRRPADIWHKPALSAVLTLAVPDLTLFALGRLDLVLYTSAGAMCALYAHGLPYAARARTLVWVVLGMVASLGVALTAASLTTSTALLVVLASLVAAVHKMLCDATRIGPPGNLILTFIAASAFFVPQRLGQVPGHLALALGTGALAWLVCMAPALLRPRGPERIATARVPTRTGASALARAGLERLLIRAEAALGSPEGPRAAEGTDPADEAARLTGWARDLRSGRPLPDIALSAAQSEEFAGIAAEPAPGGQRGLRAVRTRLAPGSPLLPLGARVAAGCTLAGWTSMTVGVGHPYWAVVTAASIFQANTTLSWQRAFQRTLGNLLGLLLFTALLPLIRTGPLTMIALALLCQLGAEAWISRNYWLGSVCVTPMALLLTEFGSHLPARTLIADRWVDTVVGAAVGLVCCVLVTNRRAADRIDRALEQVAEARAAAERLLLHDPVGGVRREDVRETGRARDRLVAGLVELREAVEVAGGEWWQRALPEERIARAEQKGHRTLARLVGRLTAPVPAV